VLAFGGLGGVVFGLIASPDRGWRDPTVAIATGGGVILLMLFLWAQWRSRAPMMPLDLFRSRVFSGVNLLTLLLYSALAGAFFLLPFDLIQVHGFSALAAGGIFLPFTLIMAGLSRWSGGLIDKVGARAPLIAGPVIVALGFALLALPGAAAPYWAFLLPVATVGVGMAVAVAPLTTSVINAVPAHQAGVASGINNAVASVARLLAVALFGAIALGSFNRAIDQRLAAPLAPAVKPTIANARGKFVVEPAPATIAENDRRTADTIIRAALADSIRLSMLLAAALALGGALCAAVTMGPSRRKP